MVGPHLPSLSLSLQYLNLESSFEGKDYVCDRLLRFLVATATSGGTTEKLSFQLLEALLYRVDLNIFTGRIGGALAILQVTDLTYWMAWVIFIGIIHLSPSH